jgi:hypothetical protein
MDADHNPDVSAGAAPGEAAAAPGAAGVDNNDEDDRGIDFDEEDDDADAHQEYYFAGDGMYDDATRAEAHADEYVAAGPRAPFRPPRACCMPGCHEEAEAGRMFCSTAHADAWRATGQVTPEPSTDRSADGSRRRGRRGRDWLQQGWRQGREEMARWRRAGTA